MAPRELRIYIPHGLYVLNMVSVFASSKTATLVISKNRLISRLKKKCYKGDLKKYMKSIEVELQGTSGAERKYFTWSMCGEYGFGILTG